MKNHLLLILATLVASSTIQALDLDNDGMSDIWQEMYGIPSGTGNEDPDSDRFTNQDEATAWTNPRLSSSRLRIESMIKTSTGVTMKWKVVPSHYYYFYSSDDLKNWVSEDGIFSASQSGLATIVLNPPSTDIRFYKVEVEKSLFDTDGDGLNDGEEHFLGTLPNKTDTDGDGLPDGWEWYQRLNPLVLNAPNPPNHNGLADSDSDGLSDVSEILYYFTNPREYDTDGDTLNDGWEIANGLNPLIWDDPNVDADVDGIPRWEEEQNNTKDNNPDTDGDGVSDAQETAQGSNPNDPNSKTPPPAGSVPVSISFGDPSGSVSEKYRVKLTPQDTVADPGGVRYRTNRQYGVVQTDTFHLVKGVAYKVELVHISTDQTLGLEKPDYDYQLSVADLPVGSTAIVVNDPLGMMETHDESDSFFAKGKYATLIVATLISETRATEPPNQKRLKIGVGEKVDLTIKPDLSFLEPVEGWSVVGGTSTVYGVPTLDNVLTTSDRAHDAQVTAIVKGRELKLTFNVVEPSDVFFLREPGTGIRHYFDHPSCGWLGKIYVLPNDVSFAGNVEVMEGDCWGIGTGYWWFFNGYIHQANPWMEIIPSPTSRSNLLDAIDEIWSGAANLPSALGTFTWLIPNYFRVNGGDSKQFCTVPHHVIQNEVGKVWMYKHNHQDESANRLDPTTTW